MNKKLTLGLVGISLIIVGVIGLTYAIFTYNGGGIKENIITSGTLKMTLSEGNGITITNAAPEEDVDGLKRNGYNFVINNTGTLPINYTITLIDDLEAINKDNCSNNLLDKSNIKVSLKKDNVFKNPYLLDTVPSKIIDEGLLNPNGTINYELRLWIKKEAIVGNIQGKHYHSKLEINAKQVNGN